MVRYILIQKYSSLYVSKWDDGTIVYSATKEPLYMSLIEAQKRLLNLESEPHTRGMFEIREVQS